MKYNEQDIKQLLTNETSIWQPDDLDWLDKRLVEKLQKNQLPEKKKQELIKMMANNQAVMNRYLTLKKHNKVKNTWLSKLFQFNGLPFATIGLSLILVSFVLFKQSYPVQNIDVVRGISEVSVFPLDGSLLNKAPEYFIVNNKHLEGLKINLLVDENIIWSSEYQQSNKFYLPQNIIKRMNNGTYNWSVNNKQNTINDVYSFTIQL